MKFIYHKDMYKDYYYSSITKISVHFLDKEIKDYLLSLHYSNWIVEISSNKDYSKLFIWINLSDRIDRITVNL